MIELNCFHCSSPLKYADRIGLREECPKCHEDVHVCKNCQFYDEKAYNECREPSAERVREKDRANHCEYFSPGKGVGSGANTRDAMLAAAEALFKKKN
ncbi:MAG: hypothetical protein KF799_06585 [Bdellovibrionales bacterium]|nr:hypothetical protein [Bdellovibrionales bacterium]